MNTLSPSISPSPSHVSSCWGYRGTCDMHAMCIQGRNGSLIPSPPSQLLSLSIICTASNNSCEGGLGMRLARQLVHAVYRMPGPDHHYIMIRPFHLYITFFIALNIGPHILTHSHILTSSFLTPHTHIPSHLTHTHKHSHLTHTHTLTSHTHTYTLTSHTHTYPHISHTHTLTSHTHTYTLTSHTHTHTQLKIWSTHSVMSFAGDTSSSECCSERYAFCFSPLHLPLPLPLPSSPSPNLNSAQVES